MRRALVFVALTFLAACGPADRPVVPDANPTTDTTGPAELGQGSWEGARTVGDGRELLVALVGAREYEPGDFCSVEYWGEVHETDTTVRLTIMGKSPVWPKDGNWGCTSEGHSRQFRVRLTRPLGTRTLIEAQFNRPQPVFDGSTLWEPAWVPEGYALRYDGPGFRRLEPPTSWTRRWAPEEPPPANNHCVGTSAPIELVQGPPAEAGHRAAASRQVDVNGAVGWFTPGEGPHGNTLTWRTSSAGFTVQSRPGCVHDVAVPEDVLLRFARSLRRP